MTTIKTLIIDDEYLGRNIIREYLEIHHDIEISAECRDAEEAIAAIDKFHPDLLFLDINMPEINGFELLEMLDSLPQVIFSTAYDQYAIQAFEVNAVDYLLKPYDQQRFNTALERARQAINQENPSKSNIEKLLENLNSQKKYLQRMLVKESGRIIILNTAEILWAEAVEDYINIGTKNNKFLINQTMTSLEAKLDPDMFIRIHRSHIINLEAVQELHPWPNGRLKCRLVDGKEIVLSRAGAKRLKALMG